MNISTYNQKQFISRTELMENGLSHYKIKQLVEQGKLLSVNRKYYENLDYEGQASDFYAVPAYTEKGIVCMLSAAVHYELTTHRPLQVDVAIPREAKIPKSPEWPDMHFYYFSKQRYETGIKMITEGENKFQIYDEEKTVCDIVFYRNKLGLELAVEVMRNYVKQEQRDFNRLLAYAGKLHVEKVMRQYLEVMV